MDSITHKIDILRHPSVCFNPQWTKSMAKKKSVIDKTLCADLANSKAEKTIKAKAKIVTRNRDSMKVKAKKTMIAKAIHIWMINGMVWTHYSFISNMTRCDIVTSPNSIKNGNNIAFRSVPFVCIFGIKSTWKREEETKIMWCILRCSNYTSVLYFRVCWHLQRIFCVSQNLDSLSFVTNVTRWLPQIINNNDEAPPFCHYLIWGKHKQQFI